MTAIPVLEYDEQRYKDTKEAFERLQREKQLADDYQTQAKLKAQHEAHQEAQANIETSLQSALSMAGGVKSDKDIITGQIKDAARKLESASVAYRKYLTSQQRLHRIVLSHMQWRAKVEGLEVWQVQGLVEDFIKANVGPIENDLQGDFEHIIWSKVVG